MHAADEGAEGAGLSLPRVMEKAASDADLAATRQMIAQDGQPFVVAHARHRSTSDTQRADISAYPQRADSNATPLAQHPTKRITPPQAHSPSNIPAAYNNTVLMMPSPDYANGQYHQSNGQPAYSYHTSFYAPQYSYPPPPEPYPPVSYYAVHPQQQGAAFIPQDHTPPSGYYYPGSQQSYDQNGGQYAQSVAESEQGHFRQLTGSSSSSSDSYSYANTNYYAAGSPNPNNAPYNYGGMSYYPQYMDVATGMPVHRFPIEHFNPASPVLSARESRMSPAPPISPYQPMQYGHAAYPVSPPYQQDYYQPRRHSNAHGSPARMSQAQFSSGSPHRTTTPELSRGYLAQTKLRDAAFDRTSHLPPDHPERRHAGSKSNMPRPPAHSQWALWCGNVPSDSTHSELWRFFNALPPPGPPSPGESESDGSEPESEVSQDIDWNSTGIESIHLILRSNCAFVNYVSRRHLKHGIAVSNGKPLRPLDPRCKPLLCRVRKKDDDSKTGVGAQRGKGIHQAWAAEQDKARKDVIPESPSSDIKTGPRPHHANSASTCHSASTSSTTSSFLSKHFTKRYFILKSHTEDDLHLSVDRGLWATQSHNEPVLDQAFRTAKEGVFLIFGANKSGEFFGYAKMTGPILQDEQRISWHRSTSAESQRPDTIPEESIFGDQGSVVASPQPTTPGADLLSVHSSEIHAHSDPMKKAHNALGLTSAEAPRADTLDPKLLPKRNRDDSLLAAIEHIRVSDAAALQQVNLAGSSASAQLDDSGVWRKDTLLSPEERNARLEQMEDLGNVDSQNKGGLGAALESGWGKPFKVEWVRVSKLPFHRTKHLRNPFNNNREVKVSRDGTEVEPAVGQRLLETFWETDKDAK